ALRLRPLPCGERWPARDMRHALRHVDIRLSGSSIFLQTARNNRATTRENAMPVQIKQLHRHFVGEVSGVDLRNPLTPQEAADIEAGMDRYAVLVFHGQDISDEQQ